LIGEGARTRTIRGHDHKERGEAIKKGRGETNRRIKVQERAFGGKKLGTIV